MLFYYNGIMYNIMPYHIITYIIIYLYNILSIIFIINQTRDSYIALMH